MADGSRQESKPKGWFSRRHQTSQAHNDARSHHKTKLDRQVEAEVRAESAEPKK